MPSPISATRNWTITDTSVTLATGQTSRKVVGIATSAINSGTTAMNERKTKTSTRSAPNAASRVPSSTPGARSFAVTGGGAKCIEPRHLHRGSADGDGGQRGLRPARLGLPWVDPTFRRDVDQREGCAAVVGDERPVAGRVIGGSPRLRQRRLDPRERRIELLADAG